VVIVGKRLSKKKQENIQNLQLAANMLMEITEAPTVPKNIRKLAAEAIKVIQDEGLTEGVRAANAIHMIEDVIQDLNLPSYARVKLWNVIAVLERVRD
jgi:hypothetical protein